MMLHDGAMDINIKFVGWVVLILILGIPQFGYHICFILLASVSETSLCSISTPVKQNNTCDSVLRGSSR